MRVKVVPVVAKVVDADHALHRHVGKLHKYAKVGDPGHHALEVLAHAGQQGKAAHAAVHFALAGHGRAFAPVDLVADAQQFLPCGQRTHAIAQCGFEGAVGQQVGITANGRGKVAVCLRGKAKVPLVEGLVARLRHGPQTEAVDQKFLIRTLHAGKYALHGCGVGPGGQVLHAHASEGVKKTLDPFRVGQGVYAVQKGHARIAQMACHGLVGRDHEFFNEPVGIVTHAVAHPDHASGFVQAAVCLWQVKVEAAALAAGIAQGCVQGKGPLQHGNDFFASRVFAQGGKGCGIVVEHAGLDLIIGKPRCGAHDNLRKARLAGLALCGKGNFCQHGQPVHIGAQAAQAIGKHLWQHGLDRFGEIP